MWENCTKGKSGKLEMKENRQRRKVNLGKLNIGKKEVWKVWKF